MKRAIMGFLTLVLVLLVMDVVHEFAHYSVFRFFNLPIKEVIVFKSEIHLFSVCDANGTEWILGANPFGGGHVRIDPKIKEGENHIIILGTLAGPLTGIIPILIYDFVRVRRGKKSYLKRLFKAIWRCKALPIVTSISKIGNLDKKLLRSILLLVFVFSIINLTPVLPFDGGIVAYVFIDYFISNEYSKTLGEFLLLIRPVASIAVWTILTTLDVLALIKNKWDKL